jgi:hypothetical protein
MFWRATRTGLPYIPLQHFQRLSKVRARTKGRRRSIEIMRLSIGQATAQKAKLARVVMSGAAVKDSKTSGGELTIGLCRVP